MEAPQLAHQQTLTGTESLKDLVNGSILGTDAMTGSDSGVETVAPGMDGAQAFGAQWTKSPPYTPPACFSFSKDSPYF